MWDMREPLARLAGGSAIGAHQARQKGRASPMTSHDTAERRLRELTESRFKDYANEVLQAKSWADRDASKQAAREKRRRE